MTTTNKSMDFKRQKRLFDPTKQTVHITVIGAGSIGSFLTLTLAKLGFKHITVFDGDIIEAHNIPNQFYQHKDVSKPKVHALRKMVKEFTGTEINVQNSFLDEPVNMIPIQQNMVIVFALDSLAVRKNLSKKFEGWPIKLVDIRMGGEGWSIHNVDFTNDEQYAKYTKTLNVKVRELPCGAQSIIYTILNVSSEASRIIKLINADEPVPTVIKREMSKYLFISG